MSEEHSGGMPRAELRQQLEMVDRHVRQGRRHVRRQREILDRLAVIGGDVEMAADLLAQFEQTLATHLLHRERLRAGRWFRS